MSLIVGVLVGLAAAVCQSVSFFCSRLFVTGRDRPVLRLLVLGHLIMGAMSALVLSVWRPGNVPPLSAFLWPLLGTAIFYLLGQTGLFFALRHTEASRASPLLGLKILILAGITVLFLKGHLTPLQWLAVVLSVLAAFLLAYSGRSLPASAVAAIVLACVPYCLSDLSIFRLVGALNSPPAGAPVGMGLFRASLLGVCLCYVVCGLIATVLLPLAGRGAMADWPYALPFAASWLAAMVFLFACFATIGVVFGNIVQSTRGLITVAVGARLAHGGMVRLEPKLSRRLLLRRVGAAALMCLAIVLYFIQQLTG